MATPPTFVTGQVLTAAQMNTIGMHLVKTQTIGTGVASVTVTDAFSADYDAYKIVVTGVKNTTSDISISLQLNNATTVGYYGAFTYVNYTTNTQSSASQVNQASFVWVGSAATGNNVGGLICDILNPFATCFTRIVASPITYQNISGTFTGIQDGNLSHTGFTIAAGAGSLTGGTIRVYGYRN
jgi:hypothetical protein